LYHADNPSEDLHAALPLGGVHLEKRSNRFRASESSQCGANGWRYECEAAGCARNFVGINGNVKFQ
jgi:hypothetical protein